MGEGKEGNRREREEKGQTCNFFYCHAKEKERMGEGKEANIREREEKGQT